MAIRVSAQRDEWFDGCGVCITDGRTKVEVWSFDPADAWLLALKTWREGRPARKAARLAALKKLN